MAIEMFEHAPCKISCKKMKQCKKKEKEIGGKPIGLSPANSVWPANVSIWLF